MITTDYARIKQTALIIRAVNHPFRQNILNTLDNAGEMTVTELQRSYDCPQPVVSQALAILRRSGFVTTKRNKKEIIYSVNHQMLQKLNTFTDQLLG